MLHVKSHPMEKQGLVSLVTMRMIASLVTPELVLVQEGNTMFPTRVVTRPNTLAIMETSTSKQWATFWYSKMERKSIFTSEAINLADGFFD